MAKLRLIAGLCAGLTFWGGLAAAATTVPPGKEVYRCLLTVDYRHVIPDHLVIIRDLATNQIEVMNPLIHKLYNRPLLAQVKDDNPDRLDFDWTVEDLPIKRGGQRRAVFNVTFIKNSASVYEGVILSGFKNDETSSGHCVPQS
ncbi:hypothetical protein GC209_15530 [bacterium]|nr:hypothetical protein [bacterium]